VSTRARALHDIAGEKTNTIVFPLPMDLMDTMREEELGGGSVERRRSAEPGPRLFPRRHGPARPGRPRLSFRLFRAAKTWMARLKRAMTILGCKKCSPHATEIA